MRWTIAFLAISDILSMAWFSWIIPFLPLELEKSHIDVAWGGYIFAMYAVGLIIGSLFVPYLLDNFTRKTVLVYGTLLESLTILGLGHTQYFENIIFAALVMRLWEGITHGTGQAAQYAIISIVYADKIEKYQGIIEAAMGAGYVIGPFMGSFLYKYLGFEVTFWVFSALLSFQGLVFLLFFPQDTISHTKDEVDNLIDTERELSDQFNTLNSTVSTFISQLFKPI